ncbi:MAG: hypothetical protein QNJ36_04080 [Calothrix sp. MO_167.B42]|nr:hypothetical protein [Calothrix sp. MO_167.B42]
MGNIKFEKIDDSPITFDLSEEDLTNIKGGMNFQLDYKDEQTIDDLDFIIKIECYCPEEDWLQAPSIEDP